MLRPTSFVQLEARMHVPVGSPLIDLPEGVRLDLVTKLSLLQTPQEFDE